MEFIEGGEVLGVNRLGGAVGGGETLEDVRTVI
jgi:hypothetical protein